MNEGRKLKEARQQAGMTAEELAAKMHVSVHAVHSWECGRRKPMYFHKWYLNKLFNADIFSIDRDTAEQP